MQHQEAAACMLFCHDELAAFVLQPRCSCNTTYPEATLDRRPSTVLTSGQLWRGSPTPWGIAAPQSESLHRLSCSQAYEDLQVILGNCSVISFLTGWDVPSALPPTVAAQAGTGHASRFSWSGCSCCIQPAPAQSTSRGDGDSLRSAAPQYSVFCKAPHTKNKENIKIYQKIFHFPFLWR